MKFAATTPLTPEVFDEIAQRMRDNYGGPEVEYHHPRCPKILTQGKKACRCGAAPMESIFEDALEGRL